MHSRKVLHDLQAYLQAQKHTAPRRATKKLKDGGSTGTTATKATKATTQNSAADKKLVEKATVQKATNQNSTADKKLVEKATVQKATNQNNSSDKNLVEKATTQKATNQNSASDKKLEEKARSQAAVNQNNSSDKNLVAKANTAVVQTPSGPKVVTPDVTGTAKTTSTSKVVDTPSGSKTVTVPAETFSEKAQRLLLADREMQRVRREESEAAQEAARVKQATEEAAKADARLIALANKQAAVNQNNASDAGIMALAKTQTAVNQDNAADAGIMALAKKQAEVNQNNAADAGLIALANKQAEVNQNNAADAKLIGLADTQKAVNQNNAADAGIMALANKQAEVNQNNAADAKLIALANNTGGGTKVDLTKLVDIANNTSSGGTKVDLTKLVDIANNTGGGTKVDLTKLVDIANNTGGGGSSSGGGGSSSGGGGSSSGGGSTVTPPVVTPPVVTPPVVTPPPPAPWSVSRPPPGYRYGFDPEWDYQFKAPVLAPLAPAVPKAAAGGRVSTGNPVADRRIAEGDQRVINNQKAAAMYAAQDNARTGSDIPEHLKQWLPTENPRGPTGRAMEDGMGAAKSYRNFWDRINGAGPGAGYTNPLDWINGGGMGGSYANPGTNIRGLGAVVNDLQQGGIGALARDLVNGAGLGASGDKFRGGKYAVLANTIGLNPAGEKKSIFNRIPEASPELEAQWAANQRYGWKPEKDKTKNKFNLNNLLGTGGTKETTATGEAEDKYAGGVVRYAEGGITDLGAKRAPAQPPMGNEKELISSAIAAIKGQVEDPRPILGAFLAKYGEEALRNLVDKVESGEVDATATRSEGMLRGPGDGMDDRIPATVGGKQDVLLANNEYIVPADVISALGNGSSDAGAEHMDKMLERVRTAAHGKATQQKKVSADKVLPA